MTCTAQQKIANNAIKTLITCILFYTKKLVLEPDFAHVFEFNDFLLSGFDATSWRMLSTIFALIRNELQHSSTKYIVHT